MKCLVLLSFTYYETFSQEYRRYTTFDLPVHSSPIENFLDVTIGSDGIVTEEKDYELDETYEIESGLEIGDQVAGKLSMFRTRPHFFFFRDASRRASAVRRVDPGFTYTKEKIRFYPEAQVVYVDDLGCVNHVELKGLADTMLQHPPPQQFMQSFSPPNQASHLEELDCIAQLGSLQYTKKLFEEMREGGTSFVMTVYKRKKEGSSFLQRSPGPRHTAAAPGSSIKN
jgi:hypothetical protein